MPLCDRKTSHYDWSGILKLNDLFNFEVAKLMHQIFTKKLSKILNHILQIHLISQNTPLVKSLQTVANCKHFYLVFILLEHNDP